MTMLVRHNIEQKQINVHTQVRANRKSNEKVNCGYSSLAVAVAVFSAK